MIRTMALEYPLCPELAGWENAGRSPERKEGKMTFSYAVIADGGIVLVADSQVTYTHLGNQGQVVGTYEGCRGKIKRIGKCYAFSAAGNGG